MRPKELKRRREDLCFGSMTLSRVHRHLLQGMGRSMDPRYVAAAKDSLSIMERAWRELEEDDQALRRDEAKR
jgi:hypothetical protein